MISDRTSAILLITAYFSKEVSDTMQPLSIAEWAVIGTWLVEKNLNPEDLLTGYTEHLSDWKHATITKKRLISLLERKASLAIALDKWTKAGIWVLNRSETAYPQKIRERLKNAAPPLLFGLGNQKLLNQKYIAILGGKEIDQADEIACSSVVGRVVAQGYGVVTGGNKGIEELALLETIDSQAENTSGGAARAGLAGGIGAVDRSSAAVITGTSGVSGASGEPIMAIVSDNLLKRSTSSQLRTSIMCHKLVLISAYNPEAGTSANNSAATNKLIYAQSELSIIIKCELKGPTMTGASENIAKAWVPVYVIKPKELGKSGNREIVKIGGKWLEEGFDVTEIMKINDN